MANEKLTKFILACNEAKKITPFRGRLLALDPGETTGYAVFQGQPETGYDWLAIDQIKTWPEHDAYSNIWMLLQSEKPSLVVNESYRIYDWKSDDHKWSQVNTVQVIGCIWTLCFHYEIQRAGEQSAQNAKGFWTDERLKEFGLYFPAIRHGRDATRHALHYLCFGQKS
jgi:hypothetical protein